MVKGNVDGQTINSIPIMPCGLRRRSASATMLGSRVRIPLRAWTYVTCVGQVVASATRCSPIQRSHIGCVPNCVWSGNLKDEEAWDRLGLLAPPPPKKNSCVNVMHFVQRTRRNQRHYLYLFPMFKIIYLLSKLPMSWVGPPWLA